MPEPAKVKRYLHLCPIHGWEQCGTSDSLIDPFDPNADHGCSMWRDAPPPPFKAKVREEPIDAATA